MNKSQWRKADVQRAYLIDNAFELLIGVLSVIAAVAFFLSPDSLRDSAIGEAVHPFDLVWNALYIVGGVCVVVGIIGLRIRSEIFGLFVLAGAVTAEAFAIAALRGASGVSSIATFVAVGATCIFRALLVLRLITTVYDLDEELRKRQT